MMNVFIDGFRSNNLALRDAIEEACWYYGRRLMGGRMAKQITVEVKLTNRLKEKENSYGYCHILDDNLNKPREFCIELDASMKHSFDNILMWLAHEMVHLKQFVRKELWDYEIGAVQWNTKRYSSSMKYNDMPWEKEAYRLEDKLYYEFAEWYYE